VSIFNVQNLGLTAPQRRSLFTLINEKTELAKQQPLQHVVILTGDFNFPGSGESTAHLLGGRIVQHLDNHSSSSGDLTRWNEVLSNMVEIAQPSLISRIERIYSSLEQWALLLLSCSASTTWQPYANKALGLSDHSPVFVRLVLRSQAPSTSPNVASGASCVYSASTGGA
jgi:endonuclease/exonuclease/phosphatase family metal-dependent hydrolase